MRNLGWLVSVLVYAAPAVADTATPDKDASAAGKVDISPVKDQLRVWSDGKKHFVAVVPFGPGSDHLYYGDGKSFYLQRVVSSSSSGNESWSRSFWDPRFQSGYKRSVGWKEGKMTVQCDERISELKPLSDGDSAKTIAKASFFSPRWTHRAYALARDDEGNYYFVDRLREPENSKSFRLFAGPKGEMKQQKMTNTVSDSEGDMFATKTGQLRLILNKSESTWVVGKTKTKLLLVPVEDNGAMIYTELGVYSGQPLGTPCDDF